MDALANYTDFRQQKKKVKLKRRHRAIKLDILICFQIRTLTWSSLLSSDDWRGECSDVTPTDRPLTDRRGLGEDSESWMEAKQVENVSHMEWRFVNAITHPTQTDPDAGRIPRTLNVIFNSSLCTIRWPRLPKKNTFLFLRIMVVSRIQPNGPRSMAGHQPSTPPEGGVSGWYSAIPREPLGWSDITHVIAKHWVDPILLMSLRNTGLIRYYSCHCETLGWSDITHVIAKHWVDPILLMSLRNTGLIRYYSCHCETLGWSDITHVIAKHWVDPILLMSLRNTGLIRYYSCHCETLGWSDITHVIAKHWVDPILLMSLRNTGLIRYYSCHCETLGWSDITHVIAKHWVDPILLMSLRNTGLIRYYSCHCETLGWSDFTHVIVADLIC